MNIQENIRRILREDSFINYLKRRISFDTIDKRFLNSLKYAIDVFKQRKALDYGSSHFKTLVVSDLMDDIHPLLQRHYKKEGDVYDEIYDDLENFIYGKYDEVMDQVFHEKFKKEKNINESDNKKDYTKILKELVQPYYDYDGVCDIRVGYDEDDDIYDIYIVFSEEKLNDIYKGELQYHLNNVSHIRRGIYNDVDNYLPIKNVYVGTYQEPNCNTINNINES